MARVTEEQKALASYRRRAEREGIEIEEGERDVRGWHSAKRQQIRQGLAESRKSRGRGQSDAFTR
jgi:hypothetical protein